MINVHHFQDGSAIVGDGDVVVGRHHELVQAFRTQRSSQRVGNTSSR